MQTRPVRRPTDTRMRVDVMGSPASSQQGPIDPEMGTTGVCDGLLKGGEAWNVYVYVYVCVYACVHVC